MKKLKNLFGLLVFVMVTSSPLLAQRMVSVSKIIAQPASPITITSYSTNYVSSGSAYRSKGIHHEVEYQNNSQKTIVAAQFGLVAFDIWNEYLDRTGGMTMDLLPAGAKNKGEWVSSAYADFSFHTGVAYVNRVRFDDGEIWTTDLSAIVVELKKIEKDFDAGRLKKNNDEKE